MYRKTYIEINTDNLKYNVQSLISNYTGYEYYIGVVKGNAYGHGNQILKYITESGVNYLAVSTLEEAIQIRKEGLDIPILCLQPIFLEAISDAVKNNITITISNYKYFQKIIEPNIYKKITEEGKLKIHLKINSGFNRFGISDKNEVLEIFNFLKENKNNIKLEGIYSHFATTGISDKHWDKQSESFKDIVSLINLKEIPIIHFGRSSTLINHKKIDFCNGVRIGIAMYGYYKAPQKGKVFREFLRNIKNKLNKKILNISDTNVEIPFLLKPAFSLYSEIIEIRKIKKGEFSGYGASFVAEKDCFLGYISLGYADGFLKRNKDGFVSINNKRYKIIAVDMNVVTILIDENIKVGYKVELIGENISIFEIAKRNNTTVYEILCLFKESLTRILTKNI